MFPCLQRLKPLWSHRGPGQLCPGSTGQSNCCCAEQSIPAVKQLSLNTLGGGSDSICMNYPSPFTPYPALQHPFSGICPPSSWGGEEYSWKTREGMGMRRGGRDGFGKIGRVRLATSFEGKYNKASNPCYVNLPFSDG